MMMKVIEIFLKYHKNYIYYFKIINYKLFSNSKNKILFTKENISGF